MKELKPAIEEVRKRLEEANRTFEQAKGVTNRLNEQLAALQDLCDHDFNIIGHDSHYNHGECTICGLEDLWL